MPRVTAAQARRIRLVFNSAVIVFLLAALLLGTIVNLGDTLGRKGVFVAICGIALLAGCVVAVRRWMFRRITRRILDREVSPRADIHIQQCSKCGYRIDNLPLNAVAPSGVNVERNICPECGHYDLFAPGS